MNTGLMLRKLFAAYSLGNDNEFLRIAEEIIEEEEKKNNKPLAKELRKLLYNGNSGRGYLKKYKESIKIPHDRERGLPLLEIKEFKWGWSDIILDANNKSILEKILRENKEKNVLKHNNLTPSQKILFFGPPGCGKTLAAEVLSSLCVYPMAYIRFDGVVSSYLGETSANLRKIFNFINSGEWIVLFDEFDVIGKQRDSPFEHGEMKRVVNNLLQMIDNFKGDSIIIAATNHEHLLDPALWRRFDEIVHFGIPDNEMRIGVFKKYLRSISTSRINFETLAKKTEGMTPADIETICMNSIKKIVLDGQKTMTQKELIQSIKNHKERLREMKLIVKEDN